jgi:predicted transcriptional regulator
MNENRRLAESDFRFMTVIWDNEPVGSMRLVDLCAEALGWKKSTTFTMLRKMCEKGMAKNENSTVTSLVSREEVRRTESERFVSETFSGSLPGFLVAFMAGKTLTDGEVEELKQLIDEHRRG